MPSIADIYLAKGNAEANAASTRGNIYADLIRNLSSLPGQAMQQARADKQTQLQQQELSQRIALGQGQQTLQGQQIAAGQRQQQDAAGLADLWSNPDIFKPDGSVNRDGVLKIAAARAPGQVPHVLETLDRLEESRATTQAKQQALMESQRESLGKDALQIDAAGNDPGLFHLIVAARAKDQVIPQDQASELLKLTDPQQIAAVTARWKAGTRAGEPDITVIPRGGTGFDKRTNKTVVTGQPEAPNETELALKAAQGDPDAIAAMNLLKPKPLGNPAEVDDQRYRGILAKLEQNQPVTPEDLAWSHAYKTQKTLGVDTSASAASDRQTTAINAQVASQNRTQHFQNVTKAKEEIAKNVDAPYAAAIGSADELRGLVRSAQGGNKIAASLQSLQTAAAAIRANGLSRINMAEIGLPAGAGDVVDRFLNFAGKATSGQPVDTALQKDMLAVADVLEKGADKKYRAGHAAAIKLWDTPEIQPSFPPLAAPAATTPPALTPGNQRLQDR